MCQAVSIMGKKEERGEAAGGRLCHFNELDGKGCIDEEILEPRLQESE